MIDTDGECAEWAFPAEPGAVRTARHAVRGKLRAWGLEAVGDVTVLLVSELVTNSLRHASGPIGVRLVRPDPAAGNSEGAQHCSWRFPIRFRIRPASASRSPMTKVAADSTSWPSRRGAGGPGTGSRARRCGSSWLFLVSNKGKDGRRSPDVAGN